MSEIPPERFAELAQRWRLAPPQDYLHWDKMLHLPPPDGLRREEWWMALSACVGSTNY